MVASADSPCFCVPFFVICFCLHPAARVQCVWGRRYGWACSSGVEHLPFKQRVDGSRPSTLTTCSGISCSFCPDGGTGRHTVLRGRRPKGHTSSSLVPGTAMETDRGEQSRGFYWIRGRRPASSLFFLSPAEAKRESRLEDLTLVQ